VGGKTELVERRLKAARSLTISADRSRPRSTHVGPTTRAVRLPWRLRAYSRRSPLFLAQTAARSAAANASRSCPLAAVLLSRRFQARAAPRSSPTRSRTSTARRATRSDSGVPSTSSASRTSPRAIKCSSPCLRPYSTSDSATPRAASDCPALVSAMLRSGSRRRTSRFSGATSRAASSSVFAAGSSR